MDQTNYPPFFLYFSKYSLIVLSMGLQLLESPTPYPPTPPPWGQTTDPPPRAKSTPPPPPPYPDPQLHLLPQQEPPSPLHTSHQAITPSNKMSTSRELGENVRRHLHPSGRTHPPLCCSGDVHPTCSMFLLSTISDLFLLHYHRSGAGGDVSEL